MAKYDDIINGIFFDRYEAGATSVRFERKDLAAKAHQLKIAVPKNLGDIIYSYKYRKSLPQEIIKTAPEGFYWRIKNVGIAQHEFVLTQGSEFVEIDTMLATTKIPDGTPSIVKKYSISDEQALLAIVRYNRLIDIFLGVTCYSLQNHLRTTVTGIGQVETDEIYVGIRFLYKGIIIKHNKTEPTYTKTSLFLCEKRRFFMARTEKGVVATI